MLDRRHWRVDLAALFLLVIGLLLAGAVFIHDPTTAGHTYTVTSLPQQLFPERLLRWVAWHLIRTLGLGVYAWLACWFVLVVLLLQRNWWKWARRLVGWLLLVPCCSVCAEWWHWEGPHTSLVGPGGSVGAWLCSWLMQFNQDVRWIVLAASGLLALGLALDFLILPGVHLSRVGVRFLFSGLGMAGRALWKRRPASAEVSEPEAPTEESPPEQEEQPEEEEEAADSDQIPIRHHDGAALASPASQNLSTSKAKSTSASTDEFEDYELPHLDLLDEASPFDYAEHDQQLRERASLLEKTFADFGLTVRVVGINTGPVITQFEVALETGLRVYKVTRLSDDVALNLKVPSVRMVAPIPGKNAVGIEIPNESRADVRLKEVIASSSSKLARSKIPLFLGKDSEGRPLVHDLAEMPHLLIAGRTGTGKSVCMNAIILSILMTRRPDEVKAIMIDPKNGVELSEYGRIPHLMHPIVTNMKKAEAILAWAVDKMEERYDLLSRARVRNIASYNALKPKELMRRLAPETEEERQHIPGRMPYIVIFIDEMADLMMMLKKEVEGHIIRLAQKSRAAGIHLVVATQKPTVDVITGLIKSNLPARICFKVVNKSDSRVVLDEMGADKLLGKGDMLFLPPGTSNLVRAQGTFASDEEIHRVVSFLECEPSYAPELIQLSTTTQEGEGGLMERLRERDDMYEPAIEVILREGRGSVSLLQRALGIGYGRAARLIDFMAEDGIVGGYNGSNAREVLYTPEQWAELRAQQG